MSKTEGSPCAHMKSFLKKFWGFLFIFWACVIIGSALAWATCMWSLGLYLIIPLAFEVVFFELKVKQLWERSSLVERGKEVELVDYHDSSELRWSENPVRNQGDGTKL